MTAPAPSGRPPRVERGGLPQCTAAERSTLPRRIAATVAVGAGVALAAFGTVELTAAEPDTPAHVEVGSLPVGRSAGTTSSARDEPSASPVLLSIPALGLEQPLRDLRVQQDGRLGVPEDASEVGWWSDGPAPGQPGAAVIVGHVDSATGPGAFHRLSSLRPGDRIVLARDDQSTVTFTVRALREYGKNSLPTDRVYTDTGPPALRLITCSGPYDRAKGGYQDNLVVYAALASG
ncbi:class F sortase [Streptomyces physcomitrii]|uniref:Class F sortase n=1 Tax=Streptomyces physcomitrii TaxID=2724184 RepID=A0ABX1H7S3_9ACTN|nr:class F sortase [Streptomyces physcomitrii]NKI44387.1 class F sortase [Streptomyces physcomitrii]